MPQFHHVNMRREILLVMASFFLLSLLWSISSILWDLDEGDCNTRHNDEPHKHLPSSKHACTNNMNDILRKKVSKERITYLILILITILAMVAAVLKLSKWLQRCLQLKKWILDCQMPLERIEPFIVEGQVCPPFCIQPLHEEGCNSRKLFVNSEQKKHHDPTSVEDKSSLMMLGERVVIIGGSIAGLLSASCLSPFFKEVVLIERSKYEEGESVVKHRHGDLPHILVNRGQSVLDRLFPGIIQEVRRKSAQLWSPQTTPSSQQDHHQQQQEEEEKTPLETRVYETHPPPPRPNLEDKFQPKQQDSSSPPTSDRVLLNNHLESTRPRPPRFVMKNYFNASQHLKLIYSENSQPLKRVPDGNHEVTIVSRGMWESTIREYVFKGARNIKVYDGYQVLSNGKGIKVRVEPRGRSEKEGTACCWRSTKLSSNANSSSSSVSTDQQQQQPPMPQSISDSQPQQYNVQVCGVIMKKVETSGGGGTTRHHHVHSTHTTSNSSTTTSPPTTNNDTLKHTNSHDHHDDDTIELDCDLLVNCGGIQTSTEFSKLLRGVEQIMIRATVDPSLQRSDDGLLGIEGHKSTIEDESSLPQHLLFSSRINNKVRYHCFYFEPNEEAFDLLEKGIPGKLLRSPVTIVRDDDKHDDKEEDAFASSHSFSSQDDHDHGGWNEIDHNQKRNYYAFYHLLTYPQTKGVLCIPMERNMFMINLITIADAEKENNRRISEGLTLQNAKERIIEYFAKGSPFEKDLISVLQCMKDQPLRIPPPYEKEGNIFVHYDQFFHFENPVNHNETFLSGFIAMGDSVSSMNPVYAQGMTICLESALILREAIKELVLQQRKQGSEANKLVSSLPREDEHHPNGESHHSLITLEKNPTSSSTTHSLHSKSSRVFDYEFCSNFQQAIHYMLFIPWLMTSSDDIRYCDTEIPDRLPKASSKSSQRTFHNNTPKSYSRSCRWQKYMIAPLLDLMLYRIFSSGSTTEIVANYFYTILNMQDGFR